MPFSGEKAERALARRRHDGSVRGTETGQQVDFKWHTRMKFPDFNSQLSEPEGRDRHPVVKSQIGREQLVSAWLGMLNRGHCSRA